MQQLRLAEPGPAQLVTGVKRDINLLQRVSAAAGDYVIVLDISLDANRTALMNLLHTGVAIRYFDHHHAGEVPGHSLFEPHIDCAADVCTSILVDRYLHGRHRAWAVTAAYGDGLPAVAAILAGSAGLGRTTCATLEELGTCLNYNAYGETLSDLHVHPAALAEEMLAFADPIDFAKNSHACVSLAAGYVVVTIRQLHATEHTSTIFAAQCAYGLLFCAPLAATHHESIGPIAWLVMTLAGVFAAGGQISMTRAFRELPVAEGSLLQMLVPLGVALGGALFFRERLGAAVATRRPS